MKKLLSKRPLCVLLIIAFVFCSYGIFLLARGREYNVYVSYNPSYTCEKAEVFFGNDSDKTQSDLIEVKKIDIYDDYAKAVLKAKSKGSETVTFMASAYDSNSTDKTKEVAITPINIGAFNIIRNNLYSHLYIVLAALSLLLMIYYVYCFICAVRTKRYSYETIFFLSVVLVFALLLFVWSSTSVYSFIQYHTTSSMLIYSVNQNLMTMITLATLPLMLIFVISVSVSNLALIKHEGFKPTNALGIITSLVMLAGLAAVALLYRFDTEYHYKALSVAYSVASSLYVFFEIILTSAIAYGIYASKHTPSYDKDYIIILGCKIKSDGTLYPLIRGRADKAIEFSKKQLEATGREAFFIPSGGKGSDEIMAEGEAVRNYLIEQGIPEERIIAETQSATTKENMKFSKAIIDSRTENAKIAFATTSYHVFRSGAIAYGSGVNAEGMGSKTKWYFWPNAFLREVAGIFTTQPKKQIIITVLIVLCAGIGSFVYSMF